MIFFCRIDLEGIKMYILEKHDILLLRDVPVLGFYTGYRTVRFVSVSVRPSVSRNVAARSSAIHG